MTILTEIDKNINSQEIQKIQLEGTEKQIAYALSIRRTLIFLSKIKLKQLKCIIVLKEYDKIKVDKKLRKIREEEIVRLNDLYIKMIEILNEELCSTSATYFIETLEKYICRLNNHRDIIMFEKFLNPTDKDYIYYFGAIRDMDNHARHYDFNCL